MPSQQQPTTFYKILASFGVTPNSPMKYVRDISFDLMEQPGGMTKTQRQAWDALRKVETRLVADFLSWPPSERRESELKVN